MTVTARIYLDGILVAGSDADTVDPSTGMYVEGTLVIAWGRADTLTQPEASSATFALSRPGPVPWLRVGRTLAVVAVSAGVEVPVFLGSVTSLDMTFDERTGAPEVTVIADDILADLGNRRVGASPWPRERLDDRVDHVMQASRQDVPVTVPASLAGYAICKQDVDVLDAATVLQGLAASVDGVLWPSIGAGSSSALVLEDTSARPALRRLAMPAATIVIVLDDAAIAAVALTFDACTFDRDSADFTQAIDDVVTGVSVTYSTPDPSDGLAPDLDRTVDVVDSGAESPAGVWGVRRVDLITQLGDASAAQAVGERILGRLRQKGAWRVPGLAFDQASTPTITDAQLAQLVDLRYRAGQTIKVPMPAWAPVAVFLGFVEGGELNYTAGSWHVNLIASTSAAYGAADVRWDDMPADDRWSWDSWDPAITWDDLMGVGPPIGA